jgi:hypothetical protein
MSMRAAPALLAGFSLLLQGCSHWQVNELAERLPADGPEITLANLEKIDPPGRDRAQYLLDRGLLRFYTGDLAGSREDLEAAKQIMASLQAMSVTENIAAATTNETLRSYSGSPSDRVLVHLMLALNYLCSNDLGGARVEMLQADVTMQELADVDSVIGQLASARFLAGLIYEMNGERDDALISYRRAYQIMRARGETIPPALQVSLLNLAKTQDFPDEYATYVAEFGREHSVPAADEGEWLLIFFDGVVSQKIENRFPVFDPGLNTMITVVLPDYGYSGYRPLRLTLSGGASNMATGTLENLERRARDDLDYEMPAILAAATARAVAKYMVVRNSQDRGDLPGLIATVFALASEQADLRSWNMLPATIQVARIVVSMDERVRLDARAYTTPSLQELNAGRYAVLFATSLTSRVYSYPGNLRPEPEPEWQDTESPDEELTAAETHGASR